MKTIRSQLIDSEEKHIPLEVIFMVVSEDALVTVWIKKNYQVTLYYNSMEMHSPLNSKDLTYVLAMYKGDVGQNILVTVKKSSLVPFSWRVTLPNDKLYEFAEGPSQIRKKGLPLKLLHSPRL